MEEHGYSNPDPRNDKDQFSTQPVPLSARSLTPLLITSWFHPLPHGTTEISRGLAGQQQRQEKELKQRLGLVAAVTNTKNNVTATTNGFAGASYHECWTRSTSGDDDEAYR
jgi:hypothetical protein